jgi:hypothetical protein
LDIQHGLVGPNGCSFKPIFPQLGHGYPALALRWRRAVRTSNGLDVDVRVACPVVTMVVVVVVMALALMRADVAVMLVVETRPIK